jgi:hypothetical protein
MVPLPGAAGLQSKGVLQSRSNRRQSSLKRDHGLLRQVLRRRILRMLGSLIELAVAAQVSVIVTRKLRDVARGELKFPALQVLSPERCLEVFPCQL